MRGRKVQPCAGATGGGVGGAGQGAHGEGARGGEVGGRTHLGLVLAALLLALGPHALGVVIELGDAVRGGGLRARARPPRALSDVRLERVPGRRA